MSNECKKAAPRRNKDKLFTEKAFKGVIIDIGCGPDPLKKEYGFPLIESVEPFDWEHGNAQFVDGRRPNNHYDCVHSSQCLEHMVDPHVALKNWFNLVKPGGYMVVTFPDEDLYEQGHWPSRWNSDHKWTFSIYKETSWSPRHINVVDLVKCLGQEADIIRIDLIDTKYDYNILKSGQLFDQTLHDDTAEAFIELIVRKRESS